MPKAKVDPALRVLEFFETAEIGAAKFALTVAKEVVRRREAGRVGPQAATPSGVSVQGPRRTRLKPLADVPAVVGD